MNTTTGDVGLGDMPLRKAVNAISLGATVASWAFKVAGEVFGNLEFAGIG